MFLWLTNSIEKLNRGIYREYSNENMKKLHQHSDFAE